MAKFLNTLLISIASFFLCFCWLAYTDQPLWVRYAFGILLSVALFFVLTFLQKKFGWLPNKNNKKNVKAFKYALAFLTDFTPFVEVFNQNNFTLNKLNDNSYSTVGDRKILVEFIFRLNNIGVQDLINAYKHAQKIKAQNIVIFCISFEPSLWQFVKNLPIAVELVNFEGTMSFLNQNNKTIQPYYLENKNSIFDKNFFYFAFAKNRSKQYFVICIFLLLMATISYFPLYNIVVATICFGAGIYCIVNKRFNPTLNILYTNTPSNPRN